MQTSLSAATPTTTRKSISWIPLKSAVFSLPLSSSSTLFQKSNIWSKIWNFDNTLEHIWIFHPKLYHIIEFSCQNWTFKTETFQFRRILSFFAILNSKSSVKLASKNQIHIYKLNFWTVLYTPWKYDFLEFLGSEKKFRIFSVANR